MPRTAPRARGTPSPIAAARIQSGLTQAQLAARVGCTLVDISRYESGKVAPRIGKALKIAAALNVPVESLFSDNDE